MPRCANRSTMRPRSMALTLRSWCRKSAMVASRRSDRSTPKSLRARTPDRARAVSRSVLLGSVPVLAAAPPTTAFFSTTATFAPKMAALTAPASPAAPAPITTRSYGFAPLIARPRFTRQREHRNFVPAAVPTSITGAPLLPEHLPMSHSKNARAEPAEAGRDRSGIYFFVACLVALAAAWYLLNELAPLLRPLFLAVLLAYVLLPIHFRVRRHVGEPYTTIALAGLAAIILL